MINRESVSEFEQQTGIKVNLSYFSNAEELLTKLRLTNSQDYDLIVTNDYAIESLIKHNLVQKLDHTKLKFWPQIDHNLLNFYYDPKNLYSIPFYWDIYGLGYISQNNHTPESQDLNTKNILETPELSWGLVFNQAQNSQIAMLDNGLEAVLCAGQYLFSSADFLQPVQLPKIRELLIQQKNFITAYTDEKAGFLLAAGDVQLAVTQSAFIHRVLKRQPEIKFGIPKEGGFMVVDAFVISKYSTKLDWVYKFLNFIYQPKFIDQTVTQFAYLPVLTSSLQQADLNYLGGLKKLFQQDFKKLQFFKRNLPLQDVNKIWVDVKAA
jgi:spermidine/putrescine transport system substrate-binding protein